MAALTGPRIATTRMDDDAIPCLYSFPVAANVIIYPGAQVALRAGYLRPATDTAGDVVCGRADMSDAINTTGLAAGAVRCNVIAGALLWENSPGGAAITAAHVGQDCFVADDQTVALTGDVFAGKVLGLEGTRVRVLCNVALNVTPAAPATADQTGTATLAGGTVTVTGLVLNPTSRIVFARNTPGGTVGNLSAPTASRGPTSFIINSDSALETSTVDYAVIG